MIGRTYLEAGSPVLVLARWNTRPGPAWRGTSTVALHGNTGRRHGPRNVLIRRADGKEAVRGFRGLRRHPAASKETGNVE